MNYNLKILLALFSMYTINIYTYDAEVFSQEPVAFAVTHDEMVELVISLGEEWEAEGNFAQQDVIIQECYQALKNNIPIDDAILMRCMEKIIFSGTRSNVAGLGCRILEKLCNITENFATTTIFEEFSEQISAKFDQTFTIVDELAEIFNENFTILFEQLNVLANISSLCSPIPIDMPTTITQSGNYCLTNDINGPIVINADQVALDLHGRTITSTAFNPISSTGHQEIFIRNGIISGTNNSFFGNKSQQNGPSVTDNFSGVPLDIIATFELASGNFFSTPTICCNVNVSVIP